MHKTYFVDLILPLSLPKTFTYRVPRDWNDLVQVGQRVIVQFGKGRKQYSALIKKIHETAPAEYEAKYILSIVDEFPILSERQLEFWDWLAEYYMANIGEVMTAALPAGLRLASESKIVLHPDYQSVVNDLSDDEFLLIEALELRQVLKIEEIADILEVKHVQPKLRKMIEKKAIMVEEEIKLRFKPKMVDYVRLSEQYRSEEDLQKAFDQLERAQRQLEVLMNYIQMSNHFSSNPEEVRKLDLQKQSNASASLLNELVKKGIFEVYAVESGRLQTEEASKEAKALSTHQQTAYEEVKKGFDENKTVLLHGVTSSGKTEIYIKLIQEAIEQKKQVLYLLPEIALTTQIVQRLQLIFGEKIGVYHSRFNENERVEVWNAVNKFNPGHYEDFQIILGARSALFLPFQDLGLVIIDEEHESTFKQYDPAPRYQARDSAIYLAIMQNAKVLLGSATPSIESFYHAQEGKYHYVQLNKRYGEIQLPEILVADIAEATKRKQMKSHFSPELLKMMEESLEDKKQIILFQNRRGYSPILICETCGNAPQCINCDISLTYHKYKKQLNCHYCGYHIPLPSTCPSCGDTNLRVKGFGTEKIEEELAIYLPEARIQRMDLDTTRAKQAYHQIITSFQEGEVDILVGTQMVTKGLDFENVALVGVLNADNLLHFPDFRSFERAYQLMSQVAGRAGRKGKRGRVLIQTYNPDHQIIRQLIDHDYEGMYRNELIDRRNFRYPPFFRMITLTLRHRDKAKVGKAAAYLTDQMKGAFADRVLGPEAPMVERVRTFYLQQIVLKLEKGLPLKKSKSVLRDILNHFQSMDEYKSIRLGIDVDPF
ncbi:MAG: primosomal protein N' [Flavobacteriales bacterium]|nr:primosomal protein N' [Flavobacteriales bacterium]